MKNRPFSSPLVGEEQSRSGKVRGQSHPKQCISQD
jgi:hypothetical protein